MEIPRLSPPAPEESNGEEAPTWSHAEAAGSAGRRGHTQQDAEVPTERECLRALRDLNRLVVTRILTPSEANAIRANLREIIAYHQRQRSPSGAAPLPRAELRRMLREHPAMVNALASLLSEEQIADLVSDPGDGDE